MKNPTSNRTKSIDPSVLILAALLVTLSGCIETPGSQLIGLWQGRPETTQDRVKGKPEGVPSEKSAVKDTPTVLEKFDFRMTLDFVDASRVRMVMDQAGQPRTMTGTWMVVSSTANDVTIQITPNPGESDDASKAQSKLPRQFLLKFDKKNKNRFLLTELNADAGLGAILFERNSSK